MSIVWLVFAQRDLAEIVDYYQSVAGQKISGRMVKTIVQTASLLTAHPHLGSPSESVDGVHELQIPHLPYVLPYRIVGEHIEILRVFHESQDRPSQWQ